jgi:hypothetical protein
VAAIVYVGAKQIDAEEIWDFFEALSSMANVSADSPVMALHNYLERHNKPGHRLQAPIIVGTANKAVNAYLENETMMRVAWRSGGRKAEPFPLIRRPSWAE